MLFPSKTPWASGRSRSHHIPSTSRPTTTNLAMASPECQIQGLRQNWVLMMINPLKSFKHDHDMQSRDEPNMLIPICGRHLILYTLLGSSQDLPLVNYCLAIRSNIFMEMETICFTPATAQKQGYAAKSCWEFSIFLQNYTPHNV